MTGNMATKPESRELALSLPEFAHTYLARRASWSLLFRAPVKWSIFRTSLWGGRLLPGSPFLQPVPKCKLDRNRARRQCARQRPDKGIAGKSHKNRP
jgi:hypothetical protein